MKMFPFFPAGFRPGNNPFIANNVRTPCGSAGWRAFSWPADLENADNRACKNLGPLYA
jgi:hypothetical protein